jgi:hypothetical protein
MRHKLKLAGQTEDHEKCYRAVQANFRSYWQERYKGCRAVMGVGLLLLSLQNPMDY